MLLRRHSRPWLCDVFYDTEASAYLLEALCGGVAMYTVRLHLTAEESAAFERDPSSVERLAFSVAKDHGQFRSRFLTPP